ncbi:MAG: SDR family NAD(P)-dependent oxidoreductase [bacterium]|nr:SDR family NAD(P)-dependent oxidoreductase [bacterium]
MKARTVLITGGAEGLGNDLSQVLAQKDYNIIVLDRLDPGSLEQEFRDKLSEYIQLDLADLESVTGFIKGYIENSIIVIDVLIINAFSRIFKSFQDFTDFEIVNFTHASFLNQVLIANSLLKKMLENEYGRIITISSKSGIQGYSSGSLYCSLKSAWITFHESLERELSVSKRDVSITTICPDSFSDTTGNKLKHYDFITGKIKRIVLSALKNQDSAIYFPVTFKTRLFLSWQMVKKILRIW